MDKKFYTEEYRWKWDELRKWVQKMCQYDRNNPFIKKMDAIAKDNSDERDTIIEADSVQSREAQEKPEYFSERLNAFNCHHCGGSIKERLTAPRPMSDEEMKAWGKRVAAARIGKGWGTPSIPSYRY